MSVIMPLYNKGQYVERAIRSVLSQTCQDFELIIVDDGSTDDGPARVALVSDARTKLIRQRNRGPGAARNAGVSAAGSELVAFLDADDEWLPDFLGRGVDLLETVHREAATITLGHRPTVDDPVLTQRLWDDRAVRGGQYEVGDADDVQFVVWLLAFVHPCSTLARRSIVVKHGGFYDRERCVYAEDAHLWLKVMLNERIAVSRDIQVLIHKEASSLSGNLTGPHPIEPFLVNPSELVESCPPNKRRLLERILAVRAVQTSLEYAKHGKGRLARSLLAAYCSEYKPAGYRQVRACSLLAPLLSTGLPAWRWAKALAGIKWSPFSIGHVRRTAANRPVTSQGSPGRNCGAPRVAANSAIVLDDSRAR